MFSILESFWRHVFSFAESSEPATYEHAWATFRKKSNLSNLRWFEPVASRFVVSDFLCGDISVADAHTVRIP